MMQNRGFGVLFGTSRDVADIKSIAVNAVRMGFAVLPVHPGKKSPMCTLNTVERNRADKAAAARAKEAGHKGWMNVRHSNNGECGVKHAITDEKEATRVFGRLLKAHPDLNIALEVGGSRMICVDADNAVDVDEFTDLWAVECGIDALRYAKPTVSSPGKMKESGEWTHKGGGHFWYYLPDDFELPETTAGPMTLFGSVLYFKERVLLVPPSVRDEGPYVYQSDVGVAPKFLLDLLTMHIEGTAERRKIHRDKVRMDGDPIDVWSAETPWADLLIPDGWTQAHKFDSCQCEVWTRPGDDWSSPKSATAHEVGCTQWETETGHGFLHIWTDEPPDFLRTMIEATGNRSLSKLQYVAWRDHDGDYSAAMRELNLAPDVVDPWKLIGIDAPTPQQIEVAKAAIDPKDEGAREASLIASLMGTPLPAPPTAATASAQPVVGATIDETPTGGEGVSATPHDDPDEEEDELVKALRERMFSRSHLDAIPPPVWLFRGLLPRDSLARISGAPGSFKSFVALDLACCLATGIDYHGVKVSGQGKALYVAAEGVSGILKRIQAWELEHKVVVPDGKLVVLSGAVQAKSGEEWAPLCLVNRADAYDLVVLDTQARMTSGWNENDNSEMSIFVSRMDMLRQQADSCVLAVHHAGHEGDRGRGASSIWGAMDTELFLKRDKPKDISTMSIIKSKDDDDTTSWVFEPVKHTVGKDSEGEDVTSLILRVKDPAEIKETPGSTKWWDDLLTACGLKDDDGWPAIEKILKARGYTGRENKDDPLYQPGAKDYITKHVLPWRKKRYDENKAQRLIEEEPEEGAA